MRNLLLSLLLSCCISKVDAQVFKEVDQNTRIDSMIQYHIGWLNPEFVPIQKEVWKWKSPGKPLERIISGINQDDGSAVPRERFVWTYHPIFDKEITMSSWRWVDSTQNWLAGSRDSSGYDVLGRLTSIYKQYFLSDSQRWKTSVLHTITYNQAGKEKERNIQNMGDSPFLFPIDARLLYHYNGNGVLDSIVHFGLLPDSIGWKKVQLDAFFYNSEGRVIREEQLNTYPSIFKNQAYSYVYDADGRLREFIEDSGLPSGRNWRMHERSVYEFDSQGKFIREGIEVYDRPSDTWLRYAYWEIYGDLFPDVSSDSDAPLFDLCPIPNPLSSAIPFICGKLSADDVYQMRILDLQGRLILEQDFRGNEPVFWVKNLSAGLYLLGISQKGKTLHYQKIILR